MTDSLPEQAPDDTTQDDRSSIPATQRDRWEQVQDRPLARRGQGAVWTVRDKQNPASGLFALKEMRFRHGPTSLAYRRFVREISVMSTLSGAHPGVVSIVAHGIPRDGDEWQPFYVMPLAESSLERARDLKASIESVLKICIVIAQALQAAHERGIVHRDVKPGNVLLFGEERRPVLADFGICHLVDDERLTGVDAQTLGSRDYVAPELHGGGQRATVSPRADIYSLGKTLYAVLAGRDPFPREAHTEQEWHLAQLFSDARFEHIHGLLLRMVTADPDSRFSTMSECREALARALENVRVARSYVPGMYGGERLAIERFLRSKSRLEKFSGRRRDDEQIAVLEDSERAARGLIERTTPHGKSADYVSELQPEDGNVAATCAEDLLVPALLGIELGLDGLVEEWWGHTLHLALPDESRTRCDILLSDAAVGATFAVATLAWRRQRWELLRDVTLAVSRTPGPFTYLGVGADYSTKSAEWLTQFLGDSGLLAEADAVISSDPLGMLSIVSGIIVLQDLRQTPVNKLQSLAQPNVTIHGADYAALHPDYRGWTTTLPEACLKSPGRASGVAKVLGFDSNTGLLQFLRTATPVLRRWMAQTASGFRRDTWWLQEFGKHGQWARWLGEPPIDQG